MLITESSTGRCLKNETFDSDSFWDSYSTCFGTLCMISAPLPPIISTQKSAVCLPPKAWASGTAAMFFGLPAEDKGHTPLRIYVNSPFSDYFVFVSPN